MKIMKDPIDSLANEHSSPGSNKKPQLTWTWQILMISIKIELVEVKINH